MGTSIRQCQTPDTSKWAPSMQRREQPDGPKDVFLPVRYQPRSERCEPPRMQPGSSIFDEWYLETQSELMPKMPYSSKGRNRCRSRENRRVHFAASHCKQPQKGKPQHPGFPRGSPLWYLLGSTPVYWADRTGCRVLWPWMINLCDEVLTSLS